MSERSSSPLQIRVITAVVIVGTFLSGAAVGGGLCFTLRHRHRPVPMPLIGALIDRLALTEAQEDKVRSIVEAHRPQLDAIMHESFPRIRAVDEQVEREVRVVLTKEQRARLDRLKTEHSRSFGGRHFRGGEPLWPRRDAPLDLSPKPADSAPDP